MDADRAPAAPSLIEYEPAAFSIAQREGPWRDALLRRMLAVADLSAAIAMGVSLGLATGRVHSLALWASIFAPAWLVLAKLSGLYDRDQRSLRHLTVDELPRLLVWSLMCTSLLAIVLAVTSLDDLRVGTAVRGWVVASLFALTLRAIARFLWRQITPPERALIVGEGPVALAARRKFELFPDIHADIVAECEQLTVDQLRESPEYLDDVDRILIASSSLDEQLIVTLVAFCRSRQIKLSLVPPARGMFGTAVQLSHVAELPVLEYNTWDISRSTLMLKRIIDVTVSLTALIVLTPLFLIIALAIALDSRGPILFVQTRAGIHRSSFRMFKFRTMVNDAEELLGELVPFEELGEPMFKLEHDPRVTRLGRLLRRTSLDELPQLLNVLAGDMSLVGPRPEQVELVSRYEPEQLFRFAVKPGLTGPMQIYGRGSLVLDERLAVERDYVENLSIGRDLRILALTVVPTVTGRGAF